MKDEMSKTVYEQHTELFDYLRFRYPNIVEVSKQVYTTQQLDLAVGATSGCSVHWIKRSNHPSSATERRAGMYLQQRAANAQKASAAAPAAAPVTSSGAATMVLVSVPDEAKAKADLLFSMLRTINCEVVDF
jgi:hypothetical protein